MLAHDPWHADVLLVSHVSTPMDVLGGGFLVWQIALDVPVLVLDLQIMHMVSISILFSPGTILFLVSLRKWSDQINACYNCAF